MNDKMMIPEQAGMQPTSFTELSALAKHAADSKFFGANTPSQAIMIMMAGRDLGLTYTQALRAFHVIEGRPSLSADGMVAVCLGHRDVCEYFRTVSNDDKHATVETKRAGDVPRQATFTIEDANRAGLVKEKSGWTKYPSRMCLARARAFLAREVYPDILVGLYDPDEIEAAPKRQEPVSQISHMQNSLMAQQANLQAQIAYGQHQAQAAYQQQRQAPVAQMPTANDVVDATVDDEDETIFYALTRRISAAANHQELGDLSAEIATLVQNKKLSDQEKEALRFSWKERAAALKGAA